MGGYRSRPRTRTRRSAPPESLLQGQTKLANHCTVSAHQLPDVAVESVVAPGQALLPRRSLDPTPRFYGLRAFDSDDVLHLGDLGFQGERALLKIPADWLQRRHPLLQISGSRSCEWVKVRGPAE